MAERLKNPKTLGAPYGIRSLSRLLHEFYEPDTGEPIVSKGFQNWNYLVMNMLAWQEGRPVVEES